MIKIREATIEDSQNIWEWRNDQITRKMSVISEEIPFDSHQTWYKKALESKECIIYIAEFNDLNAGVIRFNLDEGNAWVISINIAPNCRGHGLGKTALEESIKSFTNKYKQQKLVAHIQKSNIASITIFKHCKFMITFENDDWTRLERY